MNPGRELDALIAQRVMGWTSVEKVCRFATEIHLRAPGKPKEPNTVCEYIAGNLVAPCLPGEFIPPYSTDIAAAWEVVEKLIEEEWWPTIERTWVTGEQWECRLLPSSSHRREENIYANAETAPHAICLAALKTPRSRELAAVCKGHPTNLITCAADASLRSATNGTSHVLKCAG